MNFYNSPPTIAESDAYVPPTVEGSNALALPALPRRSPFLYLFHPNRWMVMEGEVVPCLMALCLEDGVGGVSRTKKTGKFIIQKAIEQREREGWIAIPWDVDGVGTSYLREVVPGHIYVSRWETAHSGSQAVTSDAPAYVEWLRSLMARGVIPQPHEHVLVNLRRQHSEDLAGLYDRVHVVPSLKHRINDLEARVAAIDEAMKTIHRPALPSVQANPADLIGDSEES